MTQTPLPFDQRELPPPPDRDLGTRLLVESLRVARLARQLAQAKRDIRQALREAQEEVTHV